MKQFVFTRKRSVIISILIVLLALAGTVAAADQQPACPGSLGNRTAPGPCFQNGTANCSTWGPGTMMQQSAAGRGMPGAATGRQGGAGAIQGAGILPVACMAIGILLTGLLLVVWLIVGILLSLLLYRKLRQDKTP